jgi:TnpA family transposase
MPRKDYLSHEQRQRFDSPPSLTNAQRAVFTQLPEWAEQFYATLPTSTNRAGFLLQLGYFRTVCRFFEPSQFRQGDIAFIQKSGKNIDPNQVDMAAYQQSSSYYRHQVEILSRLGFEPFTAQHQRLLLEEAKRLAHLQVTPEGIIDSCVAYLRDRRVETPAYSSLRSIIHSALSEYKFDLEQVLEKHLHAADRAMLDDLLSKPDHLFRYELTYLRKIPQSMRPSVIRERVGLFERFKEIATQLGPLVKKLDFSETTIRYYAQYVLDSRSANVARRGTDRYLLLVAFAVHQYLSLGDALVLTMLNALSSCLNNCDSRIKEEHFQQRHQTASLVGRVARRNQDHIDALGLIERVANDGTLDDTAKVFQIRAIIDRKKISPSTLGEDHTQLASLRETQQKVQQGQELYGQLEKESIYLQNRISASLICLVFDEATSQTDIWQAVRYFQEKRGEIGQSVRLPLGFLSITDRGSVYSDVGKLRVSLYKALLFKEVALHLKAGTLNVASSYEYRSFEKYLIDKQKWNSQRDSLLRKARLEDRLSAGRFLLGLNQSLNQQYKSVNEGLGANPSVYFDKGGRWHVHRYRSKGGKEADGVSLYPQGKVISVLEVLRQVNDLTGFLGAFQFKTLDYLPKRPEDRLLYAAIIGYGENIGIRKMGLISRNLSPESLEAVATHYFSPELTLRANDLILKHSNRLPIIDLFRNQSALVHTGSDGQKIDVSIPSLRASASFKYFGDGKGITIYSHLDEAGQLIYSTVFSASEREAPYVLDALSHDEVISSDVHSTDTHGYTEAVAAITGIWGIESRPRLASIHKLQLYSIDAVSTFKEMGYRIFPNQKVDYELIVEHWDDILRLVTTIKLGHEKASTLLRRLNSYSRQNPLYKALKELGRLFKSIYILRYISQEDLRSSVEAVLSKVENANHFAKAVMLGNPQEFNWDTHYDQLIAEGCKRLIINSINYYNLLLLSQQVCNCKSDEHRQELVQAISCSSTHTWHHINLHGEFDFAEQQVKPIFEMEAILNLFTA